MMKDCITCSHENNGWCSLHNIFKIPGGCDQYSQDAAFEIVSKIQENAVEFESKMLGAAVGKWGYNREELEKALSELERYRRIGTVEEFQEMKEKKNPKKIIHIHKEFRKHRWMKRRNGEIDDMAFQYENHNGPVCERCGYSFCEFCEPDGWDKEKCETDDYLCPTCGSNVRRNSTHCNKCGQRLCGE